MTLTNKKTSKKKSTSKAASQLALAPVRRKTTTRKSASAPSQRTTAKSPAARAKPAARPKPASPVPFVSTGYWLVKSEPEAYSIDDFARDKKTLWTGVRNYQARNFMVTSMVPGDRVLFYHSNAEPSAVMGVGEVLRTNLPDPSALDPASEYYDAKASVDHPIWFCAEIGFVGRFAQPLTLAELKTESELKDMALMQKGQRLSVQPVTKSEFDFILNKSGELR